MTKHASDDDHKIRVRAYHLWEAEGRPEGRDGEFWARARDEHAQEHTQEHQPQQATGGEGAADAAPTAEQPHARPAAKPAPKAAAAPSPAQPAKDGNTKNGAKDGNTPRKAAARTAAPAQAAQNDAPKERAPLRRTGSVPAPETAPAAPRTAKRPASPR